MINAQLGFGRRWGHELGGRAGGRHGPSHLLSTLFAGGFLLSEAVIIICVAGAARACPHRILCLPYLVARGPDEAGLSRRSSDIESEDLSSRTRQGRDRERRNARDRRAGGRTAE